MTQPPDQLSLNIKLDDSVSLDKFIKCDSNRNSLEFLKSTLLENSVSNLFYLWGLEGVGKSYLMQALHREFINRDMKTLHLSFDDNRITSPDIFKNLGTLEVLLIEKIDQLPQETDWEIALFSLINEALSSKTKIYLSSNLVSKDLKIELMDLKSRLSYFTAIEIPEITDEEKKEALSQSSKRKGIPTSALVGCQERRCFCQYSTRSESSFETSAYRQENDNFVGTSSKRGHSTSATTK